MSKLGRQHPVDALFAQIEAAKIVPAEHSRDAELLKRGPRKIASKLGEESTEAIIAALSEKKRPFVAECADVLYHLLVLLSAREASLAELYSALEQCGDRPP